MSEARDSKPILIVQHAQHEHPAVIRRVLQCQGVDSIWLHPYRGDAYPQASEIGGMISLGGPMGANDEKEHPWIAREIELLKRCAGEGMPVVGVCLGGQMLARAMGGKVERNETAEVGWFPITVSEDGLSDPILGSAGRTPTVYHWHQDTFHLPTDARLLASSKNCPRQAYRLGERAYGFQFHPEADHQLILEWMGIEGVDREVEEWQENYGKKTVQSVKVQRNLALKGEMSSLRITAAVGALFRGNPVREVKPKLLERLESWMARQTPVVVQFEGPERALLYLRGIIASIVELPVGSFIFLQDDQTLRWPIRVSDLRKVNTLLASSR
jgi:GMP synthase-like glutamine amidotransferase